MKDSQPLPLVDDLKAMPESQRLEAARSWVAQVGVRDDALTPKQTVFLWLKYEMGLNQREISEIEGYSYQRASAVERNAMRNLRGAHGCR